GPVVEHRPEHHQGTLVEVPAAGHVAGVVRLGPRVDHVAQRLVGHAVDVFALEGRGRLFLVFFLVVGAARVEGGGQHGGREQEQTPPEVRAHNSSPFSLCSSPNANSPDLTESGRGKGSDPSWPCTVGRGADNGAAPGVGKDRTTQGGAPWPTNPVRSSLPP